jgi:hypothetical protein
MRSSLLPIASLAVLLAACALGQEGKVITTTDAAAPVPGMATVVDSHVSQAPDTPGGRSIPQMPGWPITVGAAGNFVPFRGPVFVDLNGDGDLEIIASSTDNRLYAWDYQGNSVPGFPVTLNNMAQWPPTVGDLDGDGDLEIVQTTRGWSSGGRLYALDHTGQILPGFPINWNDNNVEYCATLYDLDDDGHLEIVVGERAWPIGYLHVVEPDGSEWGGNWPVVLDHVPAATASVGDVDADGAAEILYLSYDSMYLLKPDGTALPGWPKQIANANFSYQSAALADLDNDGDLEIVVGAHKDAAGCYVFHHDGSLYPGWPRYFGTWSYGPPTVTDLEGDGELEIIDGRAGVFGDPNSGAFWAWTAGGVTKPGFPYTPPTPGWGGGSDGPYTVADINGDGLMEILADHNVMGDNSQGYLFGADSSGNDLPGFPLRPQGFTYMNSATIGDVDGDGDYELGVQSYLDYAVDVNLYDLPEAYSSTSRDWKVYHGRNSRGGRYPTTDACVGDLDGDGDTDQADLGILLANWGCTSGCVGDLDGDDDTDQGDLGILLADWGCGT